MGQSKPFADLMLHVSSQPGECCRSDLKHRFEPGGVQPGLRPLPFGVLYGVLFPYPDPTLGPESAFEGPRAGWSVWVLLFVLLGRKKLQTPATWA